jgi:hypothetical protein
MAAEDIKKDPIYVQLIYKAERHVHEYDLATIAKEDFKMKDSDVKSAIRKALGILRGPGGMKSPTSREEGIKARLAKGLVGLYEEEAKSSGMTRTEFSKVLLAVEDTLKVRREMGGHSRGYLEFLKEFMAQADGGAAE